MTKRKQYTGPEVMRRAGVSDDTVELRLLGRFVFLVATSDLAELIRRLQAFLPDPAECERRGTIGALYPKPKRKRSKK